eukprot:scaffold78647_cov63-Phaeocystis_antarctica.AAC.3
MQGEVEGEEVEGQARVNAQGGCCGCFCQGCADLGDVLRLAVTSARPRRARQTSRRARPPPSAAAG